MTIEQAINRVDLGNCMFFTGSGFSRGAADCLGSCSANVCGVYWCGGRPWRLGRCVQTLHRDKGRACTHSVFFLRTFLQGPEGLEKREFVRACDEMYRRAKWYIESDDAGFSCKEDVPKTLNEMLMITSENKQYLK